MSAQRSAKSANWGTPEKVLTAVRECLDGIAFDPCSSDEHNERVQAETHLTDDGLKYPWGKYRSVYVNPPGSSKGVQEWWDKFQTEVKFGIFLGFNMNQLAYLEPNPLRTADWIFIPRKRLKFVGAGDNPPHNSYLVGIGCKPWGLLEHLEGTLVQL
jgi:hypothetical protein